MYNSVKSNLLLGKIQIGKWKIYLFSFFLIYSNTNKISFKNEENIYINIHQDIKRNFNIFYEILRIMNIIKLINIDTI